MTHTVEVMQTWGERMFLLRNIPVAVLVIIAALDRADIALLGASFPMLEKTLGVHGTASVILRPRTEYEVPPQ
jgi:hypothetical protein